MMLHGDWVLVRHVWGGDRICNRTTQVSITLQGYLWFRFTHESMEGCCSCATGNHGGVVSPFLRVANREWRRISNLQLWPVEHRPRARSPVVTMQGGIQLYSKSIRLARPSVAAPSAAGERPRAAPASVARAQSGEGSSAGSKSEASWEAEGFRTVERELGWLGWMR